MGMPFGLVAKTTPGFVKFFLTNGRDGRFGLSLLIWTWSLFIRIYAILAPDGKDRQKMRHPPASHRRSIPTDWAVIVRLQ